MKINTNFRAKYLVRLDDACPTMRSEMWEALEILFDDIGIKPIVGVIPDNRDKSLMISPVDSNFWPRMKLWQDKGWEIVLHGLHHVYHQISDANKPILSVSDKSEFVGLPLTKQKELIASGYLIMSKAGVRPRAFMAPSHSFDSLTLRALIEVTDIRIITDGHTVAPFELDGFTWLPQQLWRFHNMPFGVWCICLHPNTMKWSEFDQFAHDLKKNVHRFIDFNSALNLSRPHSIWDLFFGTFYQFAYTLRRYMIKTSLKSIDASEYHKR